MCRWHSEGARLVVLALAALLALPAPAGPALFHDHGHGLAFSPDGKALLAPSHNGLSAYEDGGWWQAPGPEQGFSGFSVAERALYSSGHSRPGRAQGKPAGLMRSTDGGRNWQTLAMAGEADFPLLAAGYRSSAIYVLNALPNASLASPGLFVTLDEGKTWRRASSRGLTGEIHALGAHPSEAGTVAVATATGLYLSRDGGENFLRLDGSGAVTALAFDHHGVRLLYARALSHDIIDRPLKGGRVAKLQLPHLAGDYVTCLAHSPLDERALAFATRRRDVYLSRDAGRTWQQLASNGETADQRGEDR